MIALIAITDADADPIAPAVRAVTVGSLAALCVPADEGPVDLDAVARRGELFDGLMEHDLLPVRFGAVVEDERAAGRMVAERHDELAAALERVRGAVELGVRVQPAAGASNATAARSSGREYLRQRAREFERVQQIHDQLAAMSREATQRPGRELLRAAYLVERAKVAAFVDEVRRLQEEYAELAVLCTGPWPPFSFAAPEEPG